MNEIEFVSNNVFHGFDLKAYPDTMPLVTDRLLPTGPVLLRPKSFASFMAAMFWFDALFQRCEQRPSLFLPFVPGARQDRLNDTGDVLFTAKSVASEINRRDFNTVTIIDPHSDVTPALIDRCRVISAADCISPPSGKYAAVVSPDAGAEKRASAVAKKLGVPLLHAWKTRDVASGVITGFGLQHIGRIRGLVLVVDDICDGGGTFIGLAKELELAGLKAHLWTSHGLYTQGTAELLKRYGHIYCTDSVDGPRDGVLEIRVCEKLMVY